MSNCHHASSVIRPCELCQAMERIADLEKGADYEQTLRISLRKELAQAERDRDLLRCRSERMAAGLRELYRTLPAGEHLGIVTGLMSDWHPWPVGT